MYYTAHEVGEKFDHAVRIIIINRLDNITVISWFYIMDYFYIKVVKIDLQKQSKTPNIVSPNSHSDVEF
jgi:hypothetical protein